MGAHAEENLDALLGIEKTKKLYAHEEIYLFQHLYSCCGDIALNRYEVENDGLAIVLGV